MLREAGNQHTGSTEASVLGNGWVCSSFKAVGEDEVIFLEKIMPLSGLHPPDTQTLGSKLETPCGNEVPTGQVTLTHLFLLCQVDPSGCSAFLGRRNGFLFLKLALRLSCTFIEFQERPEGIKRRARC